MTIGNIKGLGHIGMWVSNLEKSLDFYQRLGFRLDAQENLDMRLAFLSLGSCAIELMERPANTNEELTSGVIEHIALEVDDIDLAVASACKHGICVDASKVMTMHALGGIKNVFFQGPDGEGLEFFQFIRK